METLFYAKVFDGIVWVAVTPKWYWDKHHSLSDEYHEAEYEPLEDLEMQQEGMFSFPEEFDLVYAIEHMNELGFIQDLAFSDFMSGFLDGDEW